MVESIRRLDRCWRIATVTALLVLASTAPLAGQKGVLLSEREAVEEVFPEAAYVAHRPWTPSAAERTRIEEDLHGTLQEESFPLVLVYDANRQFLGYSLVTEERGKYRPITFLVGITPDLRVKDTAVMVYREDRGGEVRSQRFLRQYRGKSVDDPIRTNADIVNISGATISVRSMNVGVRKALLVAGAAFGSNPPNVAAAELAPLGSLEED